MQRAMCLAESASLTLSPHDHAYSAYFYGRLIVTDSAQFNFPLTNLIRFSTRFFSRLFTECRK